MKRVAAAILVTASGCAYPAQHAASESGGPARVANRTPTSLCRRELATLGDDSPAPPPPPGKNPRPPPRRRVVLENRLPDSYAIVSLALPSATSLVHLEAPHAGAIGEIDGRGARGEVSVLVQAKRSGGLYDYVGDCEIVREYIELGPWDPRIAQPKKLDDIIVVVELADGRPMVHVAGVPPQRGEFINRSEE